MKSMNKIVKTVAAIFVVIVLVGFGINAMISIDAGQTAGTPYEAGWNLTRDMSVAASGIMPVLIIILALSALAGSILWMYRSGRI